MSASRHRLRRRGSTPMSLFEKLDNAANGQERWQLAEAHVRQSCPDLGDATFEQALHGQQSFVFLAPNEVIKLARNQWIGRMFAGEALIMPLLPALPGIRTPHLIDYRPDDHIIRTSRLRGVLLTTQILAALPPKTQDFAIERLATFIAALHALTPPARAEALTPDLYWRTLFFENVEKLGNKKDSPRVQAAIEYASSYDNIHEDRVPVHGDLQAGNILYDESDQSLGLIDWTGCALQYRHREFAPLTYGFPARFAEAVLKNYEMLTGMNIDRTLIQRRNDVRAIATWNADEQPEFRF